MSQHVMRLGFGYGVAVIQGFGGFGVEGDVEAGVSGHVLRFNARRRGL